MKNPSRQNGFTLIELMIVVAIVAIIASIAYPSYRSSVIKSDRSDAKVALNRAAQALERCYAEGHDYTATKTKGSCPTFPQNSPNEYYQVTATVSPTTYSLTAKWTPNSPQRDDDTCQSFSLTNTGLQHAENVSGSDTTDRCW